MEARDRYSRQTVLPEIGPEGQAAFGRSTALVVGCGALGSVQTQLLARAGVGRLVLLDRDILELNNLQRQLLYDEAQVRDGLPKAAAAARALKAINSGIQVQARVVDLDARNAASFVADADVVLDGTDNFETRYLLNDVCVKLSKPWLYGGVLGAVGMAMPILPGRGPCLRCLFPQPPPPGSLPTCDTVGVLNTAPALVASLQVSWALRVLAGGEPPASRLVQLDPWNGQVRSVAVEREAGCPCCGQRRFEFLDESKPTLVSIMCGRNAVHLAPQAGTPLDFEALRARLAKDERADYNGFVLKLNLPEQQLVVFPDGRAIVRGTRDLGMARSLYARFVTG